MTIPLSAAAAAIPAKGLARAAASKAESLAIHPRGGPATGPWLADVKWSTPGRLPGTRTDHEAAVWMENDPRSTYASWVFDQKKVFGVTVSSKGGHLSAAKDRDLAATLRTEIQKSGIENIKPNTREGRYGARSDEVHVGLGSEWIEPIPGHQQIVRTNHRYAAASAPPAIQKVVHAARAYSQQAINRGVR